MGENTNDAMVSAMKHLVGDADRVCRLCFCIIQSEDEEVALEDTVTLTRSFYVGTLTFHNMFQELGINMKDTCLPDNLCMNCSVNTINSYLFKMLCQYSLREWEVAVDKLSSSMPNNNNLTTKKSIVLFPNASSHLTSFKLISKDNAFEDIRAIIISRMKYQRTKSKRPKSKLKYCDQCPIGFQNTIQLKKHIISTHNSSVTQGVFNCEFCWRTFSANHLLLVHKEKVHLPKVIPCSKCNVKVSTERQLKSHMKKKHEEAKCDICQITLPSKYELSRHLDTHSDGYSCSRCKKHFNKKGSFVKHKSICGTQNEPSFFCDLCNKGYLRKRGLIGHMIVDHGFGNPINCPWCDKKFDHQSKLKGHIVKHTRERNFSCVICGGVFVTQAALTYHTRLHTGEKPFECDICGEKFLSSSRRMEHKRRRHLGPNKACKYCQQLFVTSHEMKKHMKRHFNPQSKLYRPLLQV